MSNASTWGFVLGQLPPRVTKDTADRLLYRLLACLNPSAENISRANLDVDAIARLNEGKGPLDEWGFTAQQRAAPYYVWSDEEERQFKCWGFWNRRMLSVRHVIALGELDASRLTHENKAAFRQFWESLLEDVQTQIDSCKEALALVESEEEAEAVKQAAIERAAKLDFEPAWNSAAIPRRRPLVHDLLFKGVTSAIVAPGGGSKSSFLSALAVALATGRGEIAGIVVVRQVKVLMHCGEDSLDEMRAKIDAVLTSHDVSPMDIAGRLVLWSGAILGDSFEVLDYSQNNSRRVEIVGAVIEAVADRVKALGVEVVIVDPFIDTLGPVTENDNAGIKLPVRAFTSIDTRADAAVMLAHHSGKAASGGSVGPGDVRAARGASAFIDGCRVVQTLTPMSEQEAEDRRVPPDQRPYFIRRDQAKFNLGPPMGTPLAWYRRTPVAIANGDTVAALVPTDPGEVHTRLPREIERKALEEVKTRFEQGRPAKRLNSGGSALWQIIFDALAQHTPGLRLTQRRRKQLTEQAKEAAAVWEREGRVKWEGIGRGAGFNVPEVSLPF